MTARTPTALKLLAGNPGKRPIKAQEPVFAAGPAPAPDWLSSEATAVWARVAPCLEANRMLTAPDIDALAIYCDVVGRFVEMRRAGQVPPPCMVGQIRQLACEFGFTPASRTRVIAPKRSPDAAKEKARFFG